MQNCYIYVAILLCYILGLRLILKKYSLIWYSMCQVSPYSSSDITSLNQLPQIAHRFIRSYGESYCWSQCRISLCEIHVKVAKFNLKVGSRRTTKIENLVVLVIILGVLILLPYYMYMVIVLILLFLLVRER